MSDQPKPLWERQHGETSTQHSNFCIFRNLGPKRTLERTIYEIAVRKIEKNNELKIKAANGQAVELATIPSYDSKQWQSGNINRQSVQNRWIERAQAWDAEVDRLSREAAIEGRLDMERRQREFGFLLLAKVRERAEQLKPEEITPRELKGLAECAINAERISRGEATQIVKSENKSEHTIKSDLINYTPEQLLAYQQLLDSFTTSSPVEPAATPAQ